MLQTNRPTSLAKCSKKLDRQCSVCASYNTAISYDVIHDVFVLFTSAKVEEILFDTLVSDQSIALLRFAH